MVTLTMAASAEDRRLVETFFVSYFYDMAQYDPQIVINPFGFPIWAPNGLPGPMTWTDCARFNWWIRDRCYLYVVWVDDAPAGFVIVCDDRQHLPPDVDYEVMDFFVTPKYRRLGVGRQAAKRTFDLFQGRWQVFQLAQNLPAQRFWHAVIAEYTNGHYTTLNEGTEQRFSNVAQPAR